MFFGVSIFKDIRVYLVYMLVCCICVCYRGSLFLCV